MLDLYHTDILPEGLLHLLLYGVPGRAGSRKAVGPGSGKRGALVIESDN